MNLKKSENRHSVLKIAKLHRDNFDVYAKYLEKYEYDVAGAVEAMGSDPSFKDVESKEKQYLEMLRFKERINKYKGAKSASMTFNVINKFVKSFDRS